MTSPPQTAGRGPVRLRGYPPALRGALHEHVEDLFRELAVMELAGPGAGGRDHGDVRVGALTGELREAFGAIAAQVRRATTEAIEARGGPDAALVDIEIEVDGAVAAHARRLGALFDEVDGLAVDGKLLTRATPPNLRLFRDWVLHEIVEQLDGAEPVSWPDWRDEVESRWSPDAAGIDDVFRLMADAAPVLIWVVGDGGVGTFFSRRWQEFTGVDLNTGERRWTDVVHADDRRAGLSAFRHAVRAGVPYELEYRLRHHDGTYRWMLDRGVPRYDASGRRVGMVGSCVDITDRRRIEDELRVAAAQAELAFDAGRMGYWRWNARTLQLRVGRPLQALLGVADDDELRTFDEYLELVHPDDRQRVRQAARHAFEHGTELLVEHRVDQPDGERRWFEIRGRPIETDDGQAIEWVGVAFDSTSAAQRSQARAEMLGQAVRARRDVERANATLRRAVGRLDTMVRQEHALADALQRALFADELPEVAGLALAARYLPGSAELTVGGDWYDVVVGPSGVLLVIGDVAGHGLHAAAVMARIRHSVHFALADLDEVSPAAVLARVNRYLIAQGGDDLATVALVEHHASGRVRHARAGHPPVLVAAGSRTRYLEGGLGPPLGTSESAAYTDATDTVEAGDTLVLYTDGLVERRREPLDVGLDRLRRAVVDEPGPDPELLLDAVLAALLEREPTDDVAVLAARTGPAAS